MAEITGRLRQPIWMVFLTMPVLLWALCVQSEEIPDMKTIRIIGSAPLWGQKTDAAREQAISAGLESAVEAVIIELLPAESLIGNLNDIGSIPEHQRSTFVQDSRVLAETRTDTSAKVLIQATLSTVKIRSYLKTAGIVPDPTRMPRILILISEQMVGELYPRYREEFEKMQTDAFNDPTLTSRLRKKGFTVIPGESLKQDAEFKALVSTPEIDSETAAQAGLRLGADVVILGSAMVYPTAETMDTAMKTFKATVSANAYLTRSGRKISSAMQTATAIHPEDGPGGRQALSKAGVLSAEAMAPDILKAWRSISAAPTRIRLSIQGSAFSLTNYVVFRKLLQETAGVGKILTREMQSGRMVLDVDFQGDGTVLAESLMLKSSEQFAVRVSDVSEDHMTIELIEL